MSLPRKRRAGALKACPTRAKSLKPAGNECGTVLPADVSSPTVANRSLVKEAEPEAQSWRRSPRLQGHSLTSSPEAVTQGDLDQGERPAKGFAEEDATEQDLVITVGEEQGGAGQNSRRRGGGRRGRASGQGGGGGGCASSQEEQQEAHSEVEIDSELDRDLENKSRQHRLTSANVRSIIHEVITNEHVVAMMKAAINETDSVPVFEPKMTRSKLKEVVERGVVIPTWNISPIKKPSEAKAQQFVDIPLDEEDSSDEEYCPDEDDEDETAEETLLESDLESTASSPRGSRGALRAHDEDRRIAFNQLSRRSRHLRVEVVPMGPPPPPQPPPNKESSFMEKLHAVDEELACSSHCMEPYQTLGGGGADSGLMAFRTRSKRPLRDVPLEELEAELQAPDFTPDLYDIGSAHEDREWTQWLQGLMSSDMTNEEEADDDDDPEYNFLADTDEPDQEDYRNDRAVRITKKEVNELMEELFDTFQEEVAVQEEEEVHEEPEEEEDKEENTPPAAPSSVSILQTVQYESPLADVLNESYRTVREQLAALRRRRTLLDSRGITWPPPNNEPPPPLLLLSHTQKLHLQQQVQQHVQLLTQVVMLCSPVDRLKTEASTARQFLSELEVFAQRGEQVRRAQDSSFSSVFRAANLQGALSLLEEISQGPTPPVRTAPNKRTKGRRFPMIPPHLAWLMATRPAFMYPELLPHVSLDPAHHPSSAHKIKIFTPAEDCLIVLGHRHFSGTARPLKMAAHYLLGAKTVTEINKHVYDICHRLPNHVLTSYYQQKKIPSMPQPCRRVEPSDQRPPVERDENIMPLWLWKSLQAIYKAVQHHSSQQGVAPEDSAQRNSTGDGAALSADPPASSSCPKTLLPPPPPRQYRFPPGTRYPPSLPERLVMQPCGFRWVCPPPAARRHPNAPPKKSRTRRRERLFTPTWKQEGKLQAIQPAPSPRLTSPAATALPPAAPSGKGTGVSGKGQGGAVMGGLTPTLGLGGLILNLPVSNPIVCPTAPTIMPSGRRLAPIAPKIAGLGKNQVSQPCNALIGLRKLPRLPSAPSLQLTPPLPQLVLVPPGLLVNPPTLLPRATAPQARVPRRRSHLQKETQKEEVRRAITEEVLPMRIEQQTQGDAEGMKARTERTGRNERTSVDKEDGKMDEWQEEEEDVERGQRDEEEEEEEEGYCGEGEGPFLMLSESSGSPAPSISSCTDAMVPEIDREDGLSCGQKMNSCTRSVDTDAEEWTEEEEERSVTEERDEETIERLSLLAWQGRCDAEKRLMKTSTTSDCERVPPPGDCWNDKQEVGGRKTPVSDSEDAVLDDDPRKETKDVAFAQAYLQKVCGVLQVVPGKVEEFLGVLNAFEREPGGRTAVELYHRLRPLLQHCPELLQDFAAFLHPDQAHQCGLLAEQQAFERSQRFLRQLELSFGESSALYRKVVRILRGGTSHSSITEVKRGSLFSHKTTNNKERKKVIRTAYSG
ncbi:hypothetical protein ACEWY4_024282 [Coilia grayii]|uniref:GON-4-like protein n=1 Tax=Coilia grayii TaxID=363190 RepID=A0ABD1J017_9TELE